MDGEERTGPRGEGDQHGVDAETGGERGEDAGGRDGGDGHRADRDVQDGGDQPHQQQWSEGMGAEAAAQDVAEATGGDHGGERAADGGEDEDLAAVLEPRLVQGTWQRRGGPDGARAWSNGVRGRSLSGWLEQARPHVARYGHPALPHTGGRRQPVTGPARAPARAHGLPTASAGQGTQLSRLRHHVAHHGVGRTQPPTPQLKPPRDLNHRPRNHTTDRDTRGRAPASAGTGGPPRARLTAVAARRGVSGSVGHTSVRTLLAIGVVQGAWR